MGYQNCNEISFYGGKRKKLKGQMVHRYARLKLSFRKNVWIRINENKNKVHSLLPKPRNYLRKRSSNGLMECKQVFELFYP